MISNAITAHKGTNNVGVILTTGHTIQQTVKGPKKY